MLANNFWKYMKWFFRPKFTQICCRRKFIKTYFYNNKPDRTTEPRTICCIVYKCIVYIIHIKNVTNCWKNWEGGRERESGVGDRAGERRGEWEVKFSLCYAHLTCTVIALDQFLLQQFLLLCNYWLWEFLVCMCALFCLHY